MGLYLWLALLIGFTESGKIGRKCYSTRDCTASYSFDKTSDCVDNLCKCKPGIEVEYSTFLAPSCDEFDFSLKLLKKSCNETSCMENEECVPMKFTESALSFVGQKSCYCKDGYLRVNDACLKASHQRVMQRCYKSNDGVVYSCDLDEFSYCTNGKCICFDNYFANITSGKCEPMSKYVKAYNLTKYQVKPNEYCRDNTHCISGLNCNSFKCSCPAPCTYNTTQETCDCGMVSYTAPKAPIILGVILGILIMVFWIYQIKKVIKKFEKKDSARIDNLDAAPRNSPSHDSSALSPLNPNTASTGGSAGLTSPSGNGFERQSPVVGYSLPPKPGSDTSGPPPPPEPSQYGINPPTAPSASYPTPSDNSLPPPYSLSPPQTDNPSVPLGFFSNPNDSTSALPYPSTPSTLPYPPSPSTLHYPPSPSASYPLNPSSPYLANTSTAPPAYNPTSTAPPAYNPTSTAPPSYNPSYP